MSRECNEQSKLTVAVIGGKFGTYHINGILAEPNRFELKTFCDLDPSVVARVRNEAPSISTICTDYREVLSDPAIDAVVVSLPHHLHETVCVEVANCKKHILVDKPIARTLDEADNIIRAAKENSVTLMVAQNFRFAPQYRAIHDMILSNEIGRPLYAFTRHIQNFQYPIGGNWRSKTSVGGGCVMGSGIHNIDLMRWFFGEPAEVFAFGVNDLNRLEGEAAASVSFRYEDGLIVTFSCNWCSHGAMGSYEWGEWDISGTNGDIAIKNNVLMVGREYGKRLDEVAIEWDKCENLWTHFADCIATGSEPLTNGAQGRASLSLVLKTYESMETGRPVAC